MKRALIVSLIAAHLLVPTFVAANSTELTLAPFHLQRLVIVDATDTPGADSGNGHAYFRQSPSTSSDILATLTFDLKPGERGLEQVDGQPIWTFSADYIDKLRAAVLKAIEVQDKLAPALKQDILAAETKTRLEDLYLPFRRKRRTKAQIAREAGL